MSVFQHILERVSTRTADFAAAAVDRLEGQLLSPWADLSVMTLGASLLIAVVWLMRGRLRPVKVLRRALFPRRWLFGPSARIDWLFTFLNLFIIGSLVGWAILSGSAIGDAVNGWLIDAFGPRASPGASGWLAVLLATFVLFLAHEAAYFSDHFLSHKVPFLWHFHRVHHLAETLSPLTNYRVHPVDSVVFFNIAALFGGVAMGVLRYAMPAAQALEVEGTNAFVLVALYLLTHLQHSHVWIPATGRLGAVILSPAHHQLHHSDDPAHHDCNFGSNLALFDWLAGTLVRPTARRPKLVFGAGAYSVDPHSIHGALVQPFIEAARPLLGRARAADEPPAPAAAQIASTGNLR
ncbi:MAG: sterol desaturase family protein [Novosphingobium sp.]